MSGTNGGGESFSEKFDRLEASHVKLMTDHEVFRAEQDRLWAVHDAKMRRLDVRDKIARKRARKLDLEARERGEALDKRIADLVSAVGALISQGGQREGRG